MTNRLPYETKGGSVSEADTFAQLLEYLRMAEEACYTIGHLRKANDDSLSGDSWIVVGQMLRKMLYNITQLATSSLRKIQ